MKKILIILFVSAFFSGYSQSIDFLDSKFADVLARAKKEKKLVFLDAYASWCGPCKMLERNTFPEKSVREYFNSNFLNIHIDMEKGEGPELARKYMVRSYPTLLFLNGDGEVIQQTMGYLGAEDFLKFAKEANNPKNKLGSPKQLFEKGESDPNFLKSIINSNANSDYEFAKKASERYFQVKKNKEFTKEEVSYILYFTKTAKDANYKVFKENKDEIIKNFPLENYQQFDNQMKLSEILEQTLDTKTGVIKEDFFFEKAIPLVGKEEAEKTLNRIKVNYYLQTANYEQYQKAALAYYKNPDEFQASELDKAAWVFSQHVTDLSALKKSVEWEEKSVMNGENAENTYVLALLYQKTGNKESAKMFAELSKNISKQQGKDSTLAEKLLTELNK